MVKTGQRAQLGNFNRTNRKILDIERCEREKDGLVTVFSFYRQRQTPDNIGRCEKIILKAGCRQTTGRSARYCGLDSSVLASVHANMALMRCIWLLRLPIRHVARDYCRGAVIVDTHYRPMRTPHAAHIAFGFAFET